MPTIQAVVFDLDGLMFNTEAIFEQSGRVLLDRRGHVMSRECLHGMIGRRPHEAFAVMVEMYQLTEPIPDLLAESQVIFDALVEEHLAPMPGLFELLDHIEARGLPKGVATSSPREYLERLLGLFELTERFPTTLAAEDVTHGKPHPEIYETAAQRIGVKPTEMLVLEDSEAGTRSAAAAGAVVVAVPHEHTVEQDFSLADCVVDSLLDRRVLHLIGA
jgi:HAD superfamily hydrolase (TIGR01509 family)